MAEMQEGMATPLLQEIQSFGLQPDAITYNTHAVQSKGASTLFPEMKQQG
jgi:hypothetical protein